MIRNAVVHMNNEQPLMCDVRALPTSADACLVCTNLRYLSGKKPPFIDNIDSWFLIPLGMVRFVEVPAAAIEEAEEASHMLALPAGNSLALAHETADDPMDGLDSEADAELLRRMREA